MIFKKSKQKVALKDMDRQKVTFTNGEITEKIKVRVYNNKMYVIGFSELLFPYPSKGAEFPYKKITKLKSYIDGAPNMGLFNIHKSEYKKLVKNNVIEKSGRAIPNGMSLHISKIMQDQAEKGNIEVLKRVMSNTKNKVKRLTNSQNDSNLKKYDIKLKC